LKQQHYKSDKSEYHIDKDKMNAISQQRAREMYVDYLTYACDKYNLNFDEYKPPDVVSVDWLRNQMKLIYNASKESILQEQEALDEKKRTLFEYNDVLMATFNVML
jgi:hypothetical protein